MRGLIFLLQVLYSYQQLQQYPSWQLDGKFDNVTENKRLTTDLLLKTTVRNEASCIANCLLNDRCKSTNFNVKTNDCELLGASINDGAPLEESVDWIHYDKNIQQTAAVNDAICRSRSDVKPYSANEDVCCIDRVGISCQKKSPFLRQLTDTVNVPTWKQNIPPLKEFSLCGWFNTAVLPDHIGGILVIYSNKNYALLYIRSDKILFEFHSSTYYVRNIQQNVWYHLCYTWHPESSQSHVNTFLNGEFYEHNTANLGEFDDGQDYMIALGNDIDNEVVNDAAQSFTGILADWNMYKKRLIRNEVLALYNGETLSDEDEILVWNWNDAMKNHQ